MTTSPAAIDRAMAAYERAQSEIIGRVGGSRLVVRDEGSTGKPVLWEEQFTPKTYPSALKRMQAAVNRLRWQRALEAAFDGGEDG